MDAAQAPAPQPTTAPPQTREVDALRLQQQLLMDTLQLGVLVLDSNDTIVQNNSSIQSLYGLAPAKLDGKKLQDTDFFLRTPELARHLLSTRVQNQPARFQIKTRVGEEDRMLELTIRPMLGEGGVRTGSLIYCDNVTVQEKLQVTIEELESTSEELQSANEELETTNEELQSTNEELETTNEELQSTNEELETTNEELQSLNEELETTNQELEERGKELDQLNSIYSQTLEKIRMPVMLVAQDRRILFWNTMALRMFGFKSRPPVNFTLEQLPLPEALRRLLIRRHRAVLVSQKPIVFRNQTLDGKNSAVDIHFSTVAEEDRSVRVLITFGPAADAGVRAEPKLHRS